MAVGRHHPPCDGVGAVLDAGHGHVDLAVPTGPGDVPGVHSAAVDVEDADSSEGDLDLLGEIEPHDSGSGLDCGLGGGVGAQQQGMGARRGSEPHDESHHQSPRRHQAPGDNYGNLALELVSGPGRSQARSSDPGEGWGSAAVRPEPLPDGGGVGSEAIVATIRWTRPEPRAAGNLAWTAGPQGGARAAHFDQWGFETDGADQPEPSPSKVSLSYADGKTDLVDVPVTVVAALAPSTTAPGGSSAATTVSSSPTIKSTPPTPAGAPRQAATKGRANTAIAVGAVGILLALTALGVAINRRTPAPEATADRADPAASGAGGTPDAQDW